MNNNKWYRFLMTEDKGPFDSSVLQLFMPSVSQCNDKKCSIEHFRSNMPRDIENRGFTNKPFGGLWTATANKIREGVYSSGWVEWVNTQMPEWFNSQGILIQPKTDNIFHIETEDDLKMLIEQFPGKNNVLGTGMVDWTRALSDEGYDGIHFGMKNGNYPDDYIDLDGWDAESTCWRIDAVKKGLIEPIKIVEIYDK